ncbi:alpha-amylase family glycosyl hydrolase [Filobacillus milosensis]|nr:alpha-amylase family glycosyl hydrolase [Filobacillus milosensis]
MKLKIIGLTLLFYMLVPFLVQAEQNKNVYYYILVDRFESGEQQDQADVDVDDPTAYHGGDYKGIENRIDHLKTLGVTHVILSPVFQSENYTGFNVTSYEELEKTFGTQSDLEGLINQLKENDIEVILHFPLNTDLAEQELVDYMTRWSNKLDIGGYYFSNTNQFSTDFWERVSEEVDGLKIGEAKDNSEELLEDGFHQVLKRDNMNELVDFFKHYDQPIDPLMNVMNLKNDKIINAMDLYDTDRFTHIFSETGSHPITHWKLAITFLMTTNNHPLFYHGSEIPLDGVKSDNTHHLMVNFLAGEDQLIKHIEKISNAYDNLPALAQGDMEILHADDSYLVFKKTYQDETNIVAINNSSTLQRVDIDLPAGKELRGILKNDLIRENSDGSYSVAVEREASNIYMVQENTGINLPLVLVFGGVMSVFIVFAILMYRKNRR